MKRKLSAIIVAVTMLVSSPVGATGYPSVQIVPTGPQAATIAAHQSSDSERDAFTEKTRTEAIKSLFRMIVNETTAIPDIIAALNTYNGFVMTKGDVTNFTSLVKITREAFASLRERQRREQKDAINPESEQMMDIMIGRLNTFVKRTETNVADERQRSERAALQKRPPVGPAKDAKQLQKENPRLRTAAEIKKAPHAAAYRDQSENFNGVDIEHYIVAIKKLVHGRISADITAALVREKRVPPEVIVAGDEALRRYIFSLLATGGTNAGLIDALLQNTYQDPRLDDVTVEAQNTNPKGQGVLEAIANSLDALGLEIGRFGKGVKQTLDWLTASGGDRIDVWTRQEGEAADTWFHLTILKGINGQNYIQIVTETGTTRRTLLERLGCVGTTGTDATNERDRGTIVSISRQDPIPVTEADRAALNAGRQPEDIIENSQESIIVAAQKRFAFVDNVVIRTQFGGRPAETLNGYEYKKTIVGEPLRHAATPAGTVSLTVSNRHIVIADDGKGMSAPLISCMFVPEEGNKKQAQNAVRVVHDTDPALTMKRISFSREKEVVVAVDVPDTIHPKATVAGGLLLEFGHLVEVPEGRDRIVMTAPYFSRAIRFMIDEIIAPSIVPRTFSPEEKIAYINTIIVGCDAYAKGNAHDERVAQTLRLYARRAAAGIVNELRRTGVILLPHDSAFAKLAVPAGARALYLHPDLFDWKGIMSVTQLDPVDVPGLILLEENDGNVRASEGPVARRLVLLPFIDESLAHIAPHDAEWHELPEDVRVPFIVTDKYIIMPRQLGESLYRLALKRKADPASLTPEEVFDYYSQKKAVEIITAAKVPTGYEIARVKDTIEQENFDLTVFDDSALDKDPIDRYLARPPVDAAPHEKTAAFVHPDARQRFVLLNNGDVMSVATGETVLRGIIGFRYVGEKRYMALCADADVLNMVRNTLGVLFTDKGPESVRVANVRKSLDEALVAKVRPYYTELGKRPTDIPSADLMALLPALYRVWPRLFVFGRERLYEENTAGVLADVAGPDRSGELSPNRDFLLVRNEHREITSCVCLASGETYYLDDRFSPVPPPAPLDGTERTYPDNVTFSHDGRYMMYVARDPEDGRQPVIIVDLANRVKTGSAGSIDKDLNVSLHPSPFAPIVCVEMKMDMKHASGFDRYLVDCETGRSIAHCDSFRTDPSGAYTAIIKDGVMCLYIHNGPEKGLYSASSFEGFDEIISITQIIANGKLDGIRLKSANGRMKTLGLVPGTELTVPESVERIRDTIWSDGRCGISFTAGGTEHEVFCDDPDAMRRLGKSGVYVHPHFPLVMDNGDPNNPLAFSLHTGYAYPLSGELLYFGKDPLFARENILMRNPQGAYGSHTLCGGWNEWKDGLYGDYDPASCSVVVRRGEGEERSYYLRYLKGESSVDDSSLSYKLKIPAGEYTELSFDGKYYVFINPATGAVAYLDPAKPTEPVFITPGATNVETPASPAGGQDRASLLTKMTEFPSDRGITNKQPFGLREGKPISYHDAVLNKEHPSESASMDLRLRLNHNTLVIGQSPESAGSFKVQRIMDIEDGGLKHYDVDYVRPDAFFDPTRGEHILQSSDRFVLIQKYDAATGSGYVTILDTERKNVDGLAALATNKSIRKAQIVASGRYMVYEDPAGFLHYYDGTTGNFKMIPREDFDGGQWQVNDRADVIMLRNKRTGLYAMYDLERGDMLSVIIPVSGKTSEFGEHMWGEHMDIDSSGSFAIMVIGGAMYVIPVRGDIRNAQKARAFACGTTDVYAFCMLLGDHDNILGWTVLDKTTGAVVVLPDPESVCLAGDPLLEVFTRDGKKIVRSSDLPNALAQVLYAESRPVDPERTIRIDDRVITIEKGRVGGVIDSKKIDTTEGSVQTRNGMETGTITVFANDVIRRTALAGRRVETFAFNDGTFAVHTINETPVKTEEECYDRVFVTDNQQWLAGLTTQYDAGGRQYLFSAAGERINLSPFLPDGYEITDVYGNVFVVSDTATGEVYTLDPAVLYEHMKKGDTGVGKADVRGDDTGKEQSQPATAMTVTRWKDEVLSHRDERIAEARAAYRALCDAVPEDFRGQVKDACRTLIDRLYGADDAAVREVFAKALEEASGTIAFPDTMPIAMFARDMARLLEHLARYVASVDETFYVSREKLEVRKEFYRDLITGIFSQALTTKDFSADAIAETALRWNRTEDAVYTALFDAYAHGAETMGDDSDLAVRVGLLVEEMRDVIGERANLATMRKIVEFLRRTTARDPEKTAVLVRQLEKLARHGGEARRRAFLLWYEAFEQVSMDALLAFADGRTVNTYSGNARGFVMFLTMDVDFVRDESGMIHDRFLPYCADVALPPGGIKLSQIIQLEKMRAKKGVNGSMMDIDYLLAMIEKGLMPDADETVEEALIRDCIVQREAGAYTAECVQNSRDAGATEVGVDFYLQSEGKEYVEEIRDNGSGALKEVALLIPGSTKTEGAQIEQTGFFGTGKYTIFKDVDRVEIITKNTEGRAFMFVFDISRDDAGVTTAIALSAIKRIPAEHLTQGVTVRRIVKVEKSIPELEYMLSMRAWKTFTGLANTDTFRIQLVNYEGTAAPVRTPQEAQLLSEAVFSPLITKKQPRPMFGLWQTSDMPEQIVNRGLRIGTIADEEEYFELVPPAFRRHYIKDWGINIQLPPLPLIRGRSGIKHKERYTAEIKKYVAIEFYKILAAKTLASADGSFTFDGFPTDLDQRLEYLDKYDRNDPKVQTMMRTAQYISEGKYDKVSFNYLKSMLPAKGRIDKEQLYIMFMMSLKVPANGRTMSLIDWLLEIQSAINPKAVQKQQSNLAELGFARTRVSSSDIPQYDRYVERAQQAVNRKRKNLEDFIIEPHTPQQHMMIDFARYIAGLMPQYRIDEIHLVSAEYGAGGTFITNQVTGKRMILLNEILAEQVENGACADAVIHEFGHFLEAAMHHNIVEDDAFWRTGFSTKKVHFTHQQVGPFASSMKQVALLFLAAKNGVRVEHTTKTTATFALTQKIVCEVLAEMAAADTAGTPQRQEERQKQEHGITTTDGAVLRAA